MPTFPEYIGPPLPKQLNPLHPRHWLLVLDWVFFHPSRLKQYLYRADPALYQRESRSINVLRQPAYRSLLLTSLLITIFIPTLFWGAVGLVGLPVNWPGVAFGVAFGVAVGAAFGVAGGVAVGVAFGVAVGVAAGVAFGVAADLVLGVASSVASSVAVGVAFGVAFGVASGVAGGVAGGVASGVAGGVTVGVALGVAGGVAFGVAGGVALGMAGGIGVWGGILQLPAYCVELCTTWWSSPLVNDLGVLPPPRRITQRLDAELRADPHVLGAVTPLLLRNPFRAHTAFRSLNHCLRALPAPLSRLYNWLLAPQALDYIQEPLEARDFRRFPPLRRVLLGGLADQFVDRGGGRSRSAEQWAWYGARWLYGSAPAHTLIGLAGLLLTLDQLADGPDVSVDERESVIRQIAALQTLRALPDGPEIVDSFALMAQAWQATALAAIPPLHEALGALKQTYPKPLRASVIETLVALGDISRELVAYEQFSSPGAQSAALNRATGLLNQLATQVEAIPLCEAVLLKAIVHHWQTLVAAEAGRLGDRVLREMGGGARQALIGGGERQSVLWQRPALDFPNPYITGRPVQPPLFVGRRDILNRIAERWQPTHTPDSIILYGHRRMGKTSIVQNLAAYAPAGSLLVYLDLKGAVVTATHMGDLLLALADKLHAAAVKAGYDLPEPQFADYQQPSNADLHFQRLLRGVLATLPTGAFLILALDEFEALETAIEKEERLPRAAYHYLRMLSQQPQVTLILAGLHTLDEMSRDYQQAFFASYINVPVSYLSVAEAEQLIARPTPEFTLNYDRRVIDEIYRVTYGQPLLMQSICSALVNHLNHELFVQQREREARILPADLDAVLTDDFLRQESRYFDGVWLDQIAGFPDQQAILATLAQQTTTPTAQALARHLNLPLEQVTVALTALKKRDLVTEEQGQWRLLMPLFQRWLQLRAGEAGMDDPAQAIDN